MKTTVIIFVISTLCHFVCAQKIEEKSTSAGVKYTVSTIVANKKSTVIRNKSNVLFKDKRKPPKEIADYYFSEINFDKESAKNARDVISQAFVSAGKPIPKENINPFFYIDPNGKILEIEFMLMDSSTVSLDDLNLIEKTLRNKFSFRTKPEQLKQVPVIKFFWPIKLKGI